MDQVATPFVSVIVACRNEHDRVGRCLDSILNSDYPADSFEVVIADGMSTDGTREALAWYAARDPRVRWIDNPSRITPAALNRALKAARGEIIVRVDAHAEIGPAYIRRAVHYLNSTECDNVGGTMQTFARDAGLFAEPIRLAITHRFGVGNSHFRTGSAAPRWVDTVFGGCWRRQVFAKIGTFNEKLARSQDIEFNTRLRRAGGRILLAPDLETRYYARSKLGSFCRHNWTNGVWAILPFAYSKVTPVRWRHLAPLTFVFMLVASILGACAGGFQGWVPVLIVGPYAIAALTASLVVAKRERSVGLALLLPVAFASLHLSYGAGSLWGAFRLAGVSIRKCLHRPERKEHASDAGQRSLDSIF